MSSKATKFKQVWTDIKKFISNAYLFIESIGAVKIAEEATDGAVALSVEALIASGQISKEVGEMLIKGCDKGTDAIVAGLHSLALKATTETHEFDTILVGVTAEVA